MRILLDNCVNAQIVTFFKGHEVKTCIEMRWAHLNNGQLLAQASTQFDVFVTTDKNIRYQQNLQTLPIPILELNSKDTRIEGLKLLEPFIPQALQQLKEYWFAAVHPDGKIEALSPRSKTA